MTKERIKGLVKSGIYTAEGILENLTQIGLCPNLIFDDNGYWGISSNGIQGIRGKDEDLEVIDFVEARFFKPTIREAVKYYVEQL